MEIVDGRREAREVAQRVALFVKIVRGVTAVVLAGLAVGANFSAAWTALGKGTYR